MKIRPVDPEIIGLEEIPKRKKLTQAEHIACGKLTDMPRGLKNCQSLGGGWTRRCRAHDARITAVSVHGAGVPHCNK